jgi:excisionase family DNA binding protein
MPDLFNPTEWISIREAAELAECSSVTLRWLARGGRISGRKRGRDWSLEKDRVLAYMKEMERLGTAKHDPRRTGEARGTLAPHFVSVCQACRVSGR